MKADLAEPEQRQQKLGFHNSVGLSLRLANAVQTVFNSGGVLTIHVT